MENNVTPYFIPPSQGFTVSASRLWNFCKNKIEFWLAEEDAYDAPFLLLPLFLGIGIVFYFNLGFEPDWVLLIVLCSFFALSIYAARRHNTLKTIIFPVFIICIGALCAKIETIRLSTVMLPDDGFAELTIRILSIEEQKNGYRILAEVMQHEETKPLPNYVRLRLRALPPGAGLGSGLHGLVFLRSFSGPVRPNSYDFAFQNYFRGIGAQGNFVRAPQVVSLSLPGLIQRLSLRIAVMRAEVTERIKTAIPGESGAVAAALITGERAGVSPAVNQALRNAGLAHILAISGLHMAMVAGMIMFIARKILGLFPIFSSYYPPKKIAAVFALIASGFYLLLSGSAVAAERSFIMVAVMLCAVLCDRAAVSLRNLAISACIIMIWQPHEVLDVSAEMSFAATAALISAFDAWSVYRRKKREREEAYAELAGILLHQNRAPSKFYVYAKAWLIKPVLSTCAASIVAGAAGGVYSAYHFNNTAPFGIISNILALPLMSVLVMPFALLGAMLMPLHLEYWPLYIMKIGIIGVEKIAYWVSSFSPRGNLGEISPSALVFLTLGMALFIFLRSKLRFFALMFIVSGFIIYALTPLPLALIAENGRIAAVFEKDKTLFGTTNRPSDFTMRIWQASYAAHPPENGEYGRESAGTNSFICEESYCSARLRDGKILALIFEAGEAAEICRKSDIIIAGFSESGEIPAVCRDKTLIKSSDLALFGAAAIYPKSFGGKGAVKIIWAVDKLVRPWNEYRRRNLRARNMPN